MSKIPVMPGQMHSSPSARNYEPTSKHSLSQNSANGRFLLETADFHNAPAKLRGLMRSKVYEVVHNARKPVFERNAILLKAANINIHDTDHQDRDGLMVAHIFNAFRDKLDQTMLEPALVAAMTHDSEYIPAALQFADTQHRRIQEDISAQYRELPAFCTAYSGLKQAENGWNGFKQQLVQLRDLPLHEVQGLWDDTKFPTVVDKKSLDPHAELGEKRIRREYDDPLFREAFGDWTPEQKDVAALAIRDHSNGSAYDPFATPLEAQVLRAADKLDNMYLRVGEWMLNPYSLQDPFRCHRYVPSAIVRQNLTIDRMAQECRITYGVDTTRVEQLMQKTLPKFTYTPEEFIAQFNEAYGHKSMPIAAEVFAKLFAGKNEMYSKGASFKVELQFPDGTSVVNSYEPAATAPNFS